MQIVRDEDEYDNSEGVVNETLARRYIQGGLSPIPVRNDGSKEPALKTWKPFQSRYARDEELERWFSISVHGIGIVCGTISRGLEVIDFDLAVLFQPWFEQVKPSVKERLTIVKTPGGWHCYYRCREICGNRKLAMWEPSHEGKKVRIETRGGRWLCHCPSPHASTHPASFMNS